MTTTTTFKGVDPNSRNSSRVLRPPGGGSNFSLGFDEPTEQPVRKNKMASNIFGTPEENQASWAKSAEWFCCPRNNQSMNIEFVHLCAQKRI
ncbi:hypothetical protein H8959_007300 [Pygathrix nigripes]